MKIEFEVPYGRESITGVRTALRAETDSSGSPVSASKRRRSGELDEEPAPLPTRNGFDIGAVDIESVDDA